MMTRNECLELIGAVYEQFVPPESLPREIGADTRLFGGDSPLDSAGLVSLLIEVEQQVGERCDCGIMLADDRAISQSRSPFRSIGTLADYIQVLLAEQERA